MSTESESRIERSAVISPCGQYRYSLSRRWSDWPMVLWVMLNPSTADDSVDDPTIRRCISFSRAWGYGGMYVGNLYPLRATNPAYLTAHPDPDGIGNTIRLREMAKASKIVVAAWGAHPFVSSIHYRSVMGNLNDRPLRCLGLTKSGAPRHPLYVKGNTPLQEFQP